MALSSIFHNSLMVNATTNETFPQLFAFPQLIDPYNPPRIVRRDADGNEIEEEAQDDQVRGKFFLKVVLLWTFYVLVYRSHTC